jgi:copper(I)-binding protein
VIRSSHRTARPGRLLVLAIAALIPALAGCEAGNNAPTQEWHQPTDGAGTVHDNISIRNVFVLGAPLGATLTSGQSAGVFLALINDGSPDRLLSVTAPGTARSVQLPGGALSLATEQPVLLTGPIPKVILVDLTRQLTGGSFIRLVMNFQNAASVTLDVPVMPRAQYYSTFSPPPTPTPAPSPAVAKSRHRRTAASAATSTPTVSPSPSTSP